MEIKKESLHGKGTAWVISHGTDLDDMIEEIREKLEEDFYCKSVDIKYLNNEYVVVAHYLGKFRYE
ncbi:hypothetical protein [Liquorilactobacillus mali]|uniref:Uncharacterized protein n=1 Tax=Liquorilactobacillus mali KCTC 3596 = DSM 20444 TaxID=1046596 RepID=J0USX6_9LACO|nr:hypothetical protein [Liquorilactobacillus mali]EJF00199.1 hypothetical protein LMA_03901 [Liquorilactobacillus mali KCTC 3596 = DSM 20444]KRN08314.1 hypothetical protein FD00_GL002299 [Liquorilactobacillus mali KCTC 3596 = DSM 20444]MDN7145349.1 hypothetical protein [Liquorilactobacillus mali]QFQ74221.1 hypothetical protein LM596_03345 [Liquorilactobacillus mali]